MGSAQEQPGRVSSTRRHGLVQDEILEQAAQLFAARGFAATSLQDIADALGTSRPALYHYFRGKDEILARLVEGLASSTERSVADALAFDGPAEAKLRNLVAALVSPIAESPGRFRLLLTTDAAVEPELAQRLADIQRTVVHAVTAVVEEGMASGAFRPRDPRVATFSVLGMINWLAWWYQPGRDPGAGEVGEALADLAATSLRSEGDGSARLTARDLLRSAQRDLQLLDELIE